MFYLTDKSLLDRVARLTNDAATALRERHEAAGWPATKESRAAKLEYDRLLRDVRDLRLLGRRMSAHFGVKPAAKVVKVAALRPLAEGGGYALPTPSAPLVTGAPNNLLESAGKREASVCTLQSGWELNNQVPPGYGVAPEVDNG